MIYYILYYIKIVLMICSFCAIELVQCKASFEVLDPSYDEKNIKIIGERNKKSVYVIIVEDQLYKKKYCVKQYCLVGKIFDSLIEVLTSGIAESANVPVNRVRLIPAEVFFPGKFYKKRMATLHTFVPGKSLHSLHYDPEKFSLQQFKKERGIFGITRTIINFMSSSPNLAKITALDTFTGSQSHGGGNILFDEESNDFYGIDLKKTFCKNLSRLAYENIKKMYVVKPFTSRQIDALKIYRDTLKKLIAKNAPSDICRKLDVLVKTTNVNNKFASLTRDSVKKCKVMIFQNYGSAQDLVKLLDEIIKKHTK